MGEVSFISTRSVSNQACLVVAAASPRREERLRESVEKSDEPVSPPNVISRQLNLTTPLPFLLSFRLTLSLRLTPRLVTSLTPTRTASSSSLHPQQVVGDILIVSEVDRFPGCGRGGIEDATNSTGDSGRSDGDGVVTKGDEMGGGVVGD